MTEAGGRAFDQRLSGDLEELAEFGQEFARLRKGLPRRVEVSPSNAERGLAQLVLTLIELLRRLLEKQALRRIEGGLLTDDEVERMGETFLKLEQKMTELKDAFGLADEDLNLDLGPLGNLM